MKTQQIEKLQAMIQNADFLNAETKNIFLAKAPYLPEKKFNDLFEIFENNAEEKKRLNERKKDLFTSYKKHLNELYQNAKKQVLEIRNRAASKKEAAEMQQIDRELNSITN